MSRTMLVLCALALGGCNVTAPVSRPQPSLPPMDQMTEGTHAPVPDLDCAPRAGRITCD